VIAPTPPQECPRTLRHTGRMNGTHAITGRTLTGLEHLKQSIRDILTTPVGSRVMRRRYGSHLFDLLDSPTNRRQLAAIFAATASALRTWEPRFALQRVAVDSVAPGRVALTVDGLYRLGGASSGSLSLTVELAR